MSDSPPRVAVRPPEYFPRLPFVALLAHVDHFVLADTFQYSRQSFQNRSKLRNPNGWQWISIPLFGHQHGRPIREVELNTDDRWRERHWRAFMYNYRSTMYFEYFEDTFQPFFDVEWAELGACTCRSVELTVELLGIDTTLVTASDLPGAPDEMDDVVDALRTRLDLDAVTLVSPEAAAPHDAGAASAMEVFTYDPPTYRQNFDGFETDMSAMDCMFNYGPESIRTIAAGATIAAATPPEAQSRG